MIMAILRRTTSANLAPLLLLVVTILCCAADAHALDIVNKQSCEITVFAPPICQPCKCPQIQCIRAPCEQPLCFCTTLCEVVPGVVVKSEGRKTLALEKDQSFPLAFLTVEMKGLAFNVKTADLKYITGIATVVITRKSCGKREEGLRALVYPNPKFAGFQRICLVRGERYGS